MSAKSQTITNNFKLFSNVKVLVVTALFIALSIVLGKFTPFNSDNIRLSFENLTILMSGIFFGPVVGLVAGVSADLLGCLVRGFAINPIITVGAGFIGFISGFLYNYTFKNKMLLRTIISVSSAHLIGSVIVKSLGLYVYYGTPMAVLVWRVPTYIIISTLEIIIIYRLLKNKGFVNQIEKVRK